MLQPSGRPQRRTARYPRPGILEGMWALGKLSVSHVLLMKSQDLVCQVPIGRSIFENALAAGVS